MSSIRTRGKKSEIHPDVDDPPRRRANKARGRGTWDCDRPPIFILVARGSGEVRYFVEKRTTSETCVKVVGSFAPAWASVLYTDEMLGYLAVGDELGMAHSTVTHSFDEQHPRAWARDDDGDGVREVHCNSCEGAGAALRTSLRMFRGVHKKYLALYVAVYETMTNAKTICGAVIRRMCFGLRALHTD